MFIAECTRTLCGDHNPTPSKTAMHVIWFVVHENDLDKTAHDNDLELKQNNLRGGKHGARPSTGELLAEEQQPDQCGLRSGLEMCSSSCNAPPNPGCLVGCCATKNPNLLE